MVKLKKPRGTGGLRMHLPLQGLAQVKLQKQQVEQQVEQQMDRQVERQKKLLTLAAALLLLVALGLSGCGGLGGDNASGANRLVVSLTATPEHVMIDNGNRHVWNGATITINGKYRYTSPVVPRGGSSYHLGDFADATGRHFDPAKQTLRSLAIEVQDLGGVKPSRFVW
ncbi:hypothetical protein [Paenibacillus koleovorans]|uniref:hypothetical protein n=1 Tax=Paenibacillus koleovorans TaxID=121608 RepID=UPI000FD8B769|nr:hypothetical protein [Paenibacillus koleovorans]